MSQRSSPSRTQTMHHSASPVDSDGVVRCYQHDEPAVHLISRSVKNPGRGFFRCPRSQGDQCNFFEWADDPRFKDVLPPSSSSNSLPNSSGQQSSPLKRARPPSFSAPPSTPSKYLRFQSTPASKQQRFLAIEQGLSHDNPSSSAESQSQGSNNNADSDDDYQFDDIDEETLFGAPDNSHSSSIPSNPHSTYRLPDLPSPSKRPRVINGKKSNSNNVDSSDIESDHEQSVAASNGRWSLSTPPQTSRSSGSNGSKKLIHGNGRDASPSDSRSGTSTVSSITTATTARGPKIEEDDETSGARVSLAASTPFRSPPTEPSDGSESAVIISSFTAHIQKLERQKIAATNSRDAKARRIAELEAEVQSLKLRNEGLEVKNRVLEEKVGLLKSRQRI